MNINKIRILLTGGSSFIGRNIIEQLTQRYIFYSPTHKDLDLLDTQAVLRYLHKNPVDIIIHAANVGGSRNSARFSGVVESNLRIFFNLISAKKYYSKMIVLGSGAEYDKSQPIVNFTEENDNQLIPDDEYGFSKYVMSEYAKQADFIMHLRLFAVFGKYEDYSTRYISNNICRALIGRNISINQDAIFDYLYIDDFIKILEYFIKNNCKEKIMNVGSGDPIKLSKIAKLIKKKINQSLDIIIKNSDFSNEYTCDNNLLLNELKSFEFISMEGSIDELIIHYRAIIESIDRDLLFFD